MRRLWSGMIWIGLLSSLLIACQQTGPTRFERLSSNHTHVTFSNTLTPSERLNGFTFTNFYNGGGVGVGDVNNDGFADLIFTGNQVSCRLYLNQGKHGKEAVQFEDITEMAGLTTDRWCSGVSMVDINQDGWLDVYISVASHPALKKTENLLFVNQGLRSGKPVFKEMATEYGLADPAFTTQSAFFDYDLDGDLDVFLLNTAPDFQNPAHVRPVISDGSHPSTGKLYRNDGAGAQGHPVFKDVSKEAGITYDELGLGVVICDFNKDGYPDIYCSNDFTSSDILYLNNGKGHFTNVIKEATAHTSMYGMGVDAADLNNDALPDLMQLDMLPKENNRLKMMLGGQDYDRKQMSVSPQFGHQMQYMRNCLQMNLGVEQRGVEQRVDDTKAPQPSALPPLFSEVGLMAGVAQTDWSWAALLADFDNDGWKDMYITNGYRKNVTDRDFITFTEDFSGFGTTEYNTKKRLELLDKVPEIPLAHYAFRNKGNGSFDDASQNWGLHDESYANGAAYADFDNDGDLDLAVNNVDGEAFIYRNQSREREPAKHYLSVSLKGDSLNRQGLGATVTIWADGDMQYNELSLVRGYLSSIEPKLHFGLGARSKIDLLRIRWPDGRVEVHRNLSADQNVTFDYARSKPDSKPHSTITTEPLFVDVTSDYPIDFAHRESDFVDFKQTAAMHKMMSRPGFALAVGDVNGDGLDDCFLGSSYRGSPACLFWQKSTGGFTKRPFPAITDQEATNALFFDADGDTDLDLYVVYGSNERPATEKAFYQDQLYLNNGKDDFSQAPATTLPDISGSGSCVVATDFDKDGDLDLFVGGRQIPGKYPLPARSYLLRNDRSAQGSSFVDVTQQLCPQLMEAGMVCSALWSDYDRDGWDDLVLAGEWMPLTIYKNNKGSFRTASPIQMPNSSGWWNCLAQGDFDHDGDLDYIAGNEGLNTLYHASEKSPVKLVAKDFNNDGTIDPLMGYYINGVCYPAVPRDALNQQVIQFRRKYQRFADYAAVTFDDLFSDDDRKGAYQVQATYLESAYVENLGQGKFAIHALPRLAQVSPIYGIVVHDFNQDGQLDVVLTGNFYPNEVNMGREDASLGLVLLGDGRGHWKPLSPTKSGLQIRGDARSSTLLVGPNKKKYLITVVNSQGLKLNQCMRLNY
ncbi:VCBS repeat-containing protein [Spirosoma sp. BT702]|uniref:VCBS repeat-containing protein n=1 Tax=Spirosoma profusum TaxID=2771354 RepID=A0A926Y1Y0_9BACT|nr:VCBS repeat-containing protein [Spirosoma profusum]MBD2704626.1 VCBS repeat-containing protein [Spirosoma profusum]